MRILIVSDTHKSHKNLEKAVERTGKIDLLIHLGDTEGDEDYIRALVDCPTHIIRGNNDFFSDLPGEEEFKVKGKRVFITHGHSYWVSVSEERLQAEAQRRGVDIVMYGHTHKPSYTEKDGKIILNPGSIAYPRQPGRRGTYMLMDVEENQDIRTELMYI